MAGFLSRLFGKGSSTKKYEDLFMTARYQFKQSVEYAFKTAVEAGVNDGVFASPAEGAAQLYEKTQPLVEKEDKADLPDLEKAKRKIK